MNNNKTNQAIQKTHKFNIVDTVALIITFAVALAIFLWIDPFDWIKSEPEMQEKTVLYVVELKGIEKSKSSMVKVDDDVVFVSDEINFGKVVEINKAPSLRWDIPERGDQMILYQNPTKDTLFVTIAVDCSYQEGVGYFLNDEQLLVGNVIDLQFPMFDISGECVSIMEKE